MDTINKPPCEDKFKAEHQALLNTKISRFPSFRDVHNPVTITLGDFLEEIRSDAHAPLVEKIREESDKDKRSNLKAKLPAVTLSGVCTNGRGGANSVTEHSGLLQLDFDEVEDVRGTISILKEDQQVVAVFRSPSGNGVKAIAAIDPKDHEGSFRAARKHFAGKRLELDSSTKDVKRLCYLSHDPEAWVADHEPVPFQPIREAPAVEITEVEPACATDLIDDAFGPPFVNGPKGPSQLNEVWFVVKYARDELVKYDPKLGRFYRYGGSDTGLWEVVSKGGMRVSVRDSTLKFLKETDQSTLAHKANTNFQTSVLTQLMGQVETDFADSRGGDFIHLKNGMLDVSKDEFRLCQFSPDYLSRNQIPVDFDPDATCPRFEDELLGMALGEEDVEAIRLYFGQCLLRRNPTQTFLMITGTPEGGKTQLLNVITEVIGTNNSYELRMSHINQRFEAFNWADKTLLYGADVKGEFLQTRGAETIKKLVGGDPMNAERKHGQEHIELKGEYNLILTSNSRLRVALDGDAGAWRRRLVIVRYDRPPPKKRIPDFGSMLVREEGSGILNFALDGLARLRLHLANNGRFPRTPGQLAQVDRLLDESDSVKAFVRDGITKGKGAKMDVDDVVYGYREFCDAKGWTPLTERQVTDQLKDLMLEFHREVQKRKPSPRHWMNVRLVSR